MTTVKAVPAGYGTVTPFLNIKGAAEAIEHFKKAFGAEELHRTAAPGGAIMHAVIKIGTSMVMISDAMMNPPTQASLHLYVEDCDAAWARATAAGCKVELAISDQPWGDRYGVVSDRWGNRWAIASHREDVSEAEMRKRFDAMMAKMAKK